jgi:hypothetical protein
MAGRNQPQSEQHFATSTRFVNEEVIPSHSGFIDTSRSDNTLDRNKLSLVFDQNIDIRGTTQAANVQAQRTNRFTPTPWQEAPGSQVRYILP